MRKYVVFSTGVTGTIDGEAQVNFTGGLCRHDVAFVEIRDNKGISRFLVDADRRVFMAGAYGSPAVIRLLDRDGSPVTGSKGQPVKLDLS